ncbi:hypothetical protein FA10DRAFT_263526 [Acaromyces ingoldii]|uniref:Uncharacterized protein n=1 Tax=Acaromyces ingoldii TaxID=215250 RepID=A0A316YUJ1_9BASI|nr:hypothetical protein FA10DRAFT_263526 [Acaromyces ingoldii]PWN92772.1 hypothetical protein FA10DRAFT_263526 [Acaromyces ingoldii]
MASGVFRTDVSRRAPASQPLLDRPFAGPSLGDATRSDADGTAAGASSSSAAYLDAAAEEVNKTIDAEVKTLIEGFEALIGLSRIRDKDKFQIAQENFELEARADVMVRAAQSLTLLSHSLKLSLLLSQQPVDAPLGPGQRSANSLDEEALQLIEKTAKHRARCAELLSQIGDVSYGMEGPADIARAGHNAEDEKEEQRDDEDQRAGREESEEDEDMEDVR